jgi:hypothetical protein
MKNKRFETNGRLEKKMSGSKWCEALSVRVVTPSGWDSIESFHDKNIDKNEFLNRAANSVLIPSEKVSRREALKMKQILSENLN